MSTNIRKAILPKPIFYDADGRTLGAPVGSPFDTYLEIILRWIPVGMETYGTWDGRERCGHFLGGVYWYGEETALPAMTIATALAARPDQSVIAGFPREELEEAVVSAIRFLCFTHDTGPADCVRPEKGLGRPEPAGTKWGEKGAGFFRESQCGVTIADLAIASILMRDHLGDEERHMLVSIAEDYLDRFAGMEPKSGVYFDTQTEENGWTALGLTASMLLLRDDARFEMWLERASLWAFRTVTTPSDRLDTRIFTDGKTIKELTGVACTTLPDGTAENHGIVHPSYMSSSIGLLGRAMTLYRLWGVEIPPHFYHRLTQTYDLIKKWCDTNGMPQAPQGMDWPYFSLSSLCVLHAAANVELKSSDGALFERRCLETLDNSSKAHKGRMIPVEVAEHCHGQQDPAVMGEKAIAGVAHSYLFHLLSGYGEKPANPEDFSKQIDGVHCYNHGGIVVHNHTHGRTTFSWRNHTMILPTPSEGMRIVGPEFGSLCAKFDIKDAAETSFQRGLKIREDQNQVCALYIEDIAEEKLRRQLFFASMEDGRVLVWERVTALASVTIEEIVQGKLCVVNDGLFGDHADLHGHRRVWWPGGSREFEGYAAGDDASDEIVELAPSSTSELQRSIASPNIESPWVNVDDRFTIAYAASGEARYENTHHFPVWHATINNLILSAHSKPTSLEPDQVACEMLLSWMPEHDHMRAEEAVPTIQAWSSANLDVRVGSRRAVCSLPDSTDARSADIRIESI